MGEQSDLIKLYSKQILSLAANIPLTEPLESPDGEATRRSPLCGSNIKVSIKMLNGKVSEYAQDVKACALGQASASAFSTNVIGRTKEEIEKGRDQLFNMLSKDGPAPVAPFDGLHVLLAAKEYPNRHASILLAFNATLDAIEAAETA